MSITPADLTFHGIWSYRFEAEGRRQKERQGKGKTRKKERGGVKMSR
jgi:hypothetical protein